MSISKNATPVDINKRRAINGEDADVIQLYPMKHAWAWQYYNAANANHWLPTEISMQLDIEQWKSKTALTADDMHLKPYSVFSQLQILLQRIIL
jgi:ribonucleoside-diphosphate reductase beta chain